MIPVIYQSKVNWLENTPVLNKDLYKHKSCSKKYVPIITQIADKIYAQKNWSKNLTINLVKREIIFSKSFGKSKPITRLKPKLRLFKAV